MSEHAELVEDIPVRFVTNMGGKLVEVVQAVKVDELRDERDRLARRVKDLEGRFKLVGKYLANGRTQQAHDLVKDTVLAVDMTQAALTPAGEGEGGTK